VSAGPVAPPRRPEVAVGAVLLDGEGRVLLIQRGQLPALGRWTIPGGRVEFGETIEEALRRELRAETGLDGRIGPLCEVFEYIEPGRELPVPPQSAEPSEPPPAARSSRGYHYVILDYLVTEPSGELRAGEDAADARFFTLDEVAGLPTTDGLLAVLRRAIEKAAQAEPGAR
jgi:8-oxo-dGTP diphosphatase